MIRLLFILFFISNIYTLSAQDDYDFPDTNDDNSGMGFYLGFNYNQLILNQNPDIDFVKYDSIESINFSNKVGYSVGMVFNFNLNKHFSCRVTPGLNFYANTISYDFNTLEDHSENLNLTVVPIPFQFNFYPTNSHNLYIAGGIKYSMLIGNSDRSTVHLLELRMNDFAFEGGIGFEITTPGITIAPEIKYSYGITNLLKPTDEIYNKAFSNIYFHTITLSIILL